jgi:6-phosphofructokinase 1
LRTGGTILGTTNKDDPFAFSEGGKKVDKSKLFFEGYHELGLDALLAIGGDGSMRILRRLAQEGGLNLVTIPKTIDNDVAYTENAIGFLTSLEVATEALDRLQPTAASHQRVMILEVMGRDAGHIALSAGIAGGADIILVPEIPYKLDNIYKRINSLAQNGKNFALIIVSEAVKREDNSAVLISRPGEKERYGGIGHYLCDKITKATNAEVRVTALGHIQRGGPPTASDRILAAAYGVHAVDLIAQHKFDRMVAWQNRQIVDIPISEVSEITRVVDPADIMVRTARGMGICLGDE